MHPFEEILSVSVEDLEIELRGHLAISWADFVLNPRRLRGSDFLMRWSQGVWSEERIVQAIMVIFCLLLPAIGRTRDAPESEITKETIATLKAQGRPTWLLALEGKPLTDYPGAVRRYIEYGASLGLPEKPLISQRRPWYKMESRVAPPFLFAYLGRRNSRFIRNHAGVIPLTCFLCVYPRQNNKDFADHLWEVLNHPATVANLPLIGKSYGSGAVKVEPRALERLPLPEYLVKELGLPREMRLF